MRARITRITTENPTLRLRGSDGQGTVVVLPTRIDLTVTAEPTNEDIARLDIAGEIILASIPERRPAALTEEALAMWADLLGSQPGTTPEPEVDRAVRLLLPEVVALRREVASLGTTVETWRREARELQGTATKMRAALDAVATHCAAITDAGASFDVDYLRKVAEQAGGTAEDLLED